MFRFIYLCDSHFFDRTPPARADDYLAAGLAKLDTVIEYARGESITTIIHGGDVFGTKVHARGLSWDAWGRIARRIRDAEEIGWHFNVGQHDMDAHRPETVQAMPLGCLVAALPNVSLLPNDARVMLHADRVGPGVHIVGRWYDFRAATTPEFYVLDPSFRQSGDEVVILTSHGLLVDKPFVGPHVLLGDLPPSEADLFLASDYHPGWPARFEGRTYYRAPGSLMRSEKPSTPRQPVFLVVSIGKDRAIGVAEVNVGQLDPFREDAPRVEREHLEATTVTVDLGIVETMREEMGGAQFVDPVSWVTQVAHEQGVSDDVRKEALGFVERARSKP